MAGLLPNTASIVYETVMSPRAIQSCHVNTANDGLMFSDPGRHTEGGLSVLETMA